MIELGSGTLYISNPDGTCHLLGNLHNADVSYEPTDGHDDYIDSTSNSYVPYCGDYEATINATCTLSKEVLMYILGIRDLILKNCPNKRVAHIALHAKKKRTRKKNIHRAVYILEKENKNGRT